MKRAGEKVQINLLFYLLPIVAIVIIVAGFLFFNPFGGKTSNATKKAASSGSSSSTQAVKYEPSQEEKDYLKNRFDQLKAVNPEAIAYVYAPGTELDEPVVQTGDNATYLIRLLMVEMNPIWVQSSWTRIIRKILVIV